MKLSHIYCLEQVDGKSLVEIINEKHVNVKYLCVRVNLNAIPVYPFPIWGALSLDRTSTSYSGSLHLTHIDFFVPPFE